jgi:hypothetical protein
MMTYTHTGRPLKVVEGTVFPRNDYAGNAALGFRLVDIKPVGEPAVTAYVKT